MLLFFLLCIPLAKEKDETSIYFLSKYLRRMFLDLVCFQASLSCKTAGRRLLIILQKDADCTCYTVNSNFSLVAWISAYQLLSHVKIILQPEICSKILLGPCIAAVLPRITRVLLWCHSAFCINSFFSSASPSRF
jgi:hypothetical protein